MSSNSQRIQDHANRLATVARHTCPPDSGESFEALAAGFIQALRRLMSEGLTLDEAYQEIYTRLADGVADG